MTTWGAVAPDREHRTPLQRVAIRTALGVVVARVGPRDGDTATVLLHGAAGTWRTWLPLLDEGERPIENVVALDLPGWGESGALNRHASIASMIRAIAQVVTSLGYSRWHVIGHSLGGHLALDLAATMPHQTASITLISATGRGTVDVLRHPVRRATRLPWLVGMLIAMRVLAVLGAAGAVILGALERVGVLRMLVAPLFAAHRSRDNANLSVVAGEVRPAAFLRAVTAARSYDDSVWSGIRCPVVNITGGRDVFVDARDAGWLSRRLPDVTSVVVEDAGHFAHVEQPTQVLAAIAASRRSRIVLPRAANSR